jgi:hypothetical protein
MPAIHLWEEDLLWFWDDAEDHGGFDRNVATGPFASDIAALADAQACMGSEDLEVISGKPPRYTDVSEEDTDLIATVEEYGERIARKTYYGMDIDSRDIHSIVTKLTTTCLEAAFPTLESLADKLAAKGRTQRDPNKFGVQVFAPDTGSAYNKAVAIETPQGNFVAVIEYDNKPNPGLDALMAELLPNIPSTPREEREPKIASVRVEQYFLQPGQYQSDLGRALNSAVADEWSRATILKRSASMEPYSYDDEHERDWSEGSGELSTVDMWVPFFRGLKAALVSEGLLDQFERDAAEYAKRVYEVVHTEADFPQFYNANRLGDSIALADGFLPGPKAIAAIRHLDKLQVEYNMSGHLKQMLNIHSICAENNVTSKDTEFDHNDLDNFVYAPETNDPNLDALVFRDQNNMFGVLIHKDQDGPFKVEVHFARDHNPAPLRAIDAAITGKPQPHSLLAAFEIDGELVTATHAPGIDEGRIRSWNGFISDLETAECCLEGEYQPKRGPGR